MSWIPSWLISDILEQYMNTSKIVVNFAAHRERTQCGRISAAVLEGESHEMTGTLRTLLDLDDRFAASSSGFRAEH
jgi:hypothetical protein